MSGCFLALRRQHAFMLGGRVLQALVSRLLSGVGACERMTGAHSGAGFGAGSPADQVGTYPVTNVPNANVCASYCANQVRCPMRPHVEFRVGL